MRVWHRVRPRQRFRRAAFIVRLKVAARRRYARVELHLAPDLDLGRRITVTVMPGTSSVLRIGPGSKIEGGVTIMLKGGRLEAGPRMELRRGVIVNLAGVLTMECDNAISWGTIVHCSNEIYMEPMAGIAEYATIADSSHFFTTPEEHFWHNVRKGSVRIGRNTWICPKATLTRGADVGAFCIVAAGSVVVGSVPDGHMASGVPAVLRPMALPWHDALT
jgi:hypothetical protein